MKKIWFVLLAFVLVFGMISCSDDSGGGKKNTGGDFTTDLCQGGPLEITLKGNFQYGKGYQENFMAPAFFNGNKVNKDDVFTLEISFTANRDLTDKEDFLAWGLVDTVTDYWNPLSWTGEAEWKLDGIRDLTSGDETTDLEIKFIALKSSPDNAPAKNALNIQFESPDDKAASGDSGAYNPNPLTLTFTKFRFSRGEGGTPPPPPPPPSMKLPVLYDNGEWVEDIGSATISNSSGNTAIEFSTAINVVEAGYTKVVIQFTSASNYRGGSVEGNGADGSSWANCQYWSGLTKVNPNAEEETDTFSGNFDNGAGEVVVLFKKLCINGEDKFSEVKKIWLEGTVYLPEGLPNMGEGDVAGSESQLKYIIKDDDFDNFMSAKYLVIETENEINGGMQLIWQGGGASGTSFSGWNQTDLLTNSGEGKDGMTTVSEDKKTLTIELAKGLKDYDTIDGNHNGLQIFLAYYSGPNKIIGLGVKKAYLLFE
jgi:hypothetical protein